MLCFAEIESMKRIYGFKPIFEEETAVKFFAFNEDQWLSYDDAETLQLKVEYAQKQGLLGLFIWSIDLDTKPHDPLKALLGGKLDRFAKKMASKIPSMIGSPYRGPNVPNAGVLIVQAA